jgi:5-methylcytosine-specific restriction protein A
VVRTPEPNPPIRSATNIEAIKPSPAPARVSFENLRVGHSYTRPELATLWGYKGYEALGRGAVTPTGTPYIILFITKEKQSFLPQYRDDLQGQRLVIEGENSHTADRRIVEAAARNDQIHLFYRERHHEPFAYMGEIYLVAYDLRVGTPSHFEFGLNRFAAASQGDLETELLTHGAGIDDFIPDEEGRQFLRQHVTYERSPKNRARAIEIHGTSCLACGFNFNRAYGAVHAASYIEVHHLRSVTAGLTIPDPGKDLIPLCANCHSMAHRRRGRVLGLDELKALLLAAGAHNCQDQSV